MADASQTYTNGGTVVSVETFTAVTIPAVNVKVDSCNGGSSPSAGGDKIGSAAFINSFDPVYYDGYTYRTAFTLPTLAASCTDDLYPNLLWQTSLAVSSGTYDQTQLNVQVDTANGELLVTGANGGASTGLITFVATFMLPNGQYTETTFNVGSCDCALASSITTTSYTYNVNTAIANDGLSLFTTNGDSTCGTVTHSLSHLPNTAGIFSLSGNGY